MAYIAISGSVKKTEFSGKRKVFYAKISPDAATGSYIFADADVIEQVVVSFAEDLTANCYSIQAAVDGTTTNKINFKLWKAGGTAADTAYLDFTVIAIGY